MKGAVLLYPVPCKEFLGKIQADSSLQIIDFHVRSLVEGGVEHLVQRTRVTYDMKHGLAVNIKIVDVTTYRGEIVEYDEKRGVGCIFQEPFENEWHSFSKGWEIKMCTKDIYRQIPEKIKPGMIVTWTTSCYKDEFARNIRFVGLKPYVGTIEFYSEKTKIGGIRPDKGGKVVPLHSGGVVDRF